MFGYILSQAGYPPSDKTSLILYLEVLLRVPVTVVDDTGVRCGQIDAETPGPGGQQEYSDLRILRARACILDLLSMQILLGHTVLSSTSCM